MNFGPCGMGEVRRFEFGVDVEWFSMHRPNWDERLWLYTDGKLWDWSNNYAVHLWFRTVMCDGMAPNFRDRIRAKPNTRR